MKTCSRIFLIGFSGCGKSSNGKKIAKAFDYQFIDTDALFEKKVGISISDFFEQYGENQFRMQEYEILKNVLKMEKVVAATGGGMPCFADALPLMLENGWVIYLKLSVKMLCARLTQSAQKRPLLKNKIGTELFEFVNDMLQKRSPFYEQADTIIENTSRMSIAEIIKLRNMKP